MNPSVTTPAAPLLLAALALSACSHLPAPTPVSAAAAPVCMQLQVSRLQPGRGPLMAAAYGSADGFLKQPVWVHRAQADGEHVSLAVCGVASAELAFTVFQDLNSNGKLDMNPMGVPTEPYGMSGRPVFGPPSWEQARVSAAPGSTVRIEL